MAFRGMDLGRYKFDTIFHDGSVVHKRPLARVSDKTWRRKHKIGAGAFGDLWLEQEDESGQLRAVKDRLKSHFNPEEILVMVAMNDHPTLFVEFLGFFENQNTTYLTMEYLECGDLAEYIRRDGANASIQAREITSQILSGLVVLHDREICHRDLKPQNIMIASLSPIWVKITDFVCAVHPLEAEFGTPGYMAPEVLGLLPRRVRGGAGYANAVDIWALGVVVHEILCSEIPFLETYPDSIRSGISTMTDMDDTFVAQDVELLYSYCRGTSEFPSDSLRRNGVSIEGIDFVKSLMASDPSRRVTAAQALQSPWLTGSSYSAAAINEMWAASHNSETTAPAVGYIGNLPTPLNTETDSIAEPTGENTQSALDAAASAGDVDLIKPLVDMGANINWASTNRNGQTALHAAASGGHLDAIQLLLDLGANVNGASASENGQTALHAAAGGGHLAALKLLVRMGAKLDAWSPSKHGQTALHAAAGGGHLEAIKLLLDMGADIRGASASQNGQTALHAAAGGGHLGVIRLLLGTGANVDASSASENSQSALHAASAAGHLGAIKLLFENGANINTSSASQNGQSPLHAASAAGHLGAIKLLLDLGAKVNAASASQNGQTALHAAAGGGHLDAVKLLLKMGADVNGASGSQNGQTALHAAASGGHQDTIKLLLETGANVNTSAASENSQSALHGAASAGHLGAIKLLLDMGANINGASASPNGQIPLHAAAGGGHIDAIKLLLDRGASIGRRDLSAIQDPVILALLEDDQHWNPVPPTVN